jgi:hypothetical protein
VVLLRTENQELRTQSLVYRKIRGRNGAARCGGWMN